MQRFSSIMALLVMFGSVWIHGLVPVAASAHDMMSDMGTPACLSHCLATIHTDSVNNVTTASVFHFVVPNSSGSITSSTIGRARPTGEALFTSHHDPGLVLKTIKRE